MRGPISASRIALCAPFLDPFVRKSCASVTLFVSSSYSLSEPAPPPGPYSSLPSTYSLTSRRCDRSGMFFAATIFLTLRDTPVGTGLTK